MFLEALPARLTAAVSPADLERATRPPAGIEWAAAPASLRVDGRLLSHPVPEISLRLAEPVDAAGLCAAWGVADPVAVSADVHQRTWDVRAAGRTLVDPHAVRVVADPIMFGRWCVTPRLAARPPGPLPERVSGASPAYAAHGAVVSLHVAPVGCGARIVAPDHPDARALLAEMATVHPVWRGGWRPDPAAAFVLVDGGAGAALSVSGDRATASMLALPQPDAVLAAALLDVLEAVARDRGCAWLRLDSSAFLVGVPYAAYGYETGPPYAGDADVDTWAERRL